jgi:hypothetical protein
MGLNIIEKRECKPCGNLEKGGDRLIFIIFLFSQQSPALEFSSLLCVCVWYCENDSSRWECYE